MKHEDQVTGRREDKKTLIKPFSSSHLPVILSVLLFACGGGQPEPQHVEPVVTAAPAHKSHGMSVSGQLGSIDETATRKTFDRLSGKFQSCQSQGLSRIEYLSGDVKFFLRI